MKPFLIASALALGLVFALGGQPKQRSNDDAGVQSRMERGVERMDGYLAQGLTQDTHDQLASRAQASVDFFDGLKSSVANVEN